MFVHHLGTPRTTRPQTCCAAEVMNKFPFTTLHPLRAVSRGWEKAKNGFTFYECGNKAVHIPAK